jgi:hypothetical protein
MPWSYIALIVAALILSVALAPRARVPTASTLEDFDFPQVDEGTPQIVIFGDCWIDGWMVLSFGNLRTEPIAPEGGGGGGKK